MRSNSSGRRIADTSSSRPERRSRLRPASAAPLGQCARAAGRSAAAAARSGRGGRRCRAARSETSSSVHSSRAASSMSRSRSRTGASAPSARPGPLERAGTSRAASSASSAATCRVSWAITAQSAHGTPSWTCRSRSSRAIASNSSAGERSVSARTEPSSLGARRRASRCATTPTAPMRCVTRRTRSRLRRRAAVRAVQHPASRRGARPGARSSRASRRGTLPTRRPDRRTRARRSRARRTPRRSSTPPSVSSCASSTSTISTRSSAARPRAAAVRTQPDRLAHEPGGIAMRAAHAGAHLEVLREERRQRDPGIEPVPLAERAQAPRARCRASCTRRGTCAPRCGSPSCRGWRARATPASVPRPARSSSASPSSRSWMSWSSSPPVSSCGGSASARDRRRPHELEGERGDRPRERARTSPARWRARAGRAAPSRSGATG